MSESCTCSLQARLHQVENARSREMKAHGEMVQKLELELESRRIGEAEFRLLVAKLRTDTCRLEAELCASTTKTRQLLDQLDIQRTERDIELKSLREEHESKLHNAREKCDQLFEDNRQLNSQLFECQTLLGNAKHESKFLLEKNERLCSQTNSQAVEIDRLSIQLKNKQQEIETTAMRSQLMLEDLTNSRKQQESLHGRVQELELDINHALMTRNRALQWRWKRQEMWEKQFLSRRTFLVWKSISVQAALRTTAKMAQHNEDTRAHLQLIEIEVLKRCSQIKGELSNVRQACIAERKQMQSWREEFCQTELSKLLTLLRRQQNESEIQRERLELQCNNQRERIEIEQERLKMSRQDAEHRVQKLTETHQSHCKRQLNVIIQTFTARRQRELHRRTFIAWKELFLRSIVGQATHTAMVFQSKNPQTSLVDISSPIDRIESQSWAMPASIRPTPIVLQPLQLEKLNLSDGLRSPVSEATTPIDAMWRKWRRVDIGTGRGNKPHPSPITPA